MLPRLLHCLCVIVGHTHTHTHTHNNDSYQRLVIQGLLMVIKLNGNTIFGEIFQKFRLFLYQVNNQQFC